jgi:predicted small secreted protein
MIRSHFARLTTLGLLLVAALAMGACENTIRGVGEDVEDTGEAVEDAVD